MSKLAHSHQPTMDKIDAAKAFAELSFNEAFGLLVAHKRKEKHWNQHELASHVGKSRTTIANIETGRQGMSFEDGLKMMRILSISADELLPKRDIFYV